MSHQLNHKKLSPIHPSKTHFCCCCCWYSCVLPSLTVQVRKVSLCVIICNLGKITAFINKKTTPLINMKDKRNNVTITSQNSVSLSSGKSPLASSRRKSLLINFLKPQSLPWTNLYALWLSVTRRK